MVAVVLVLTLQAAAEPSPLQKLDAEVAAIVAKLRPSAVQVTASFLVGPAEAADTLTFSGAVYSKEGHVVTDAAGVTAAASIRVTVAGRSHPAAHVASDRRSGVAVLKISAEGLVPADFADAPPAAGATAVAVGNAYGLAGSASVGGVSGLDRSIVSGGRTFDGMIQITNLLHNGDCGAPVADARGRVVGLVHSVFTGETADGRNAGILHLFQKEAKDLAPASRTAIAFVTPAPWVRLAADRIIKHGRMVRGWAGFSARASDSGAEVVAVVEDGPAARAGLLAADVVVEADGEAVKDLEALRFKVASKEPESRLKLAVVRNKERREVEVVLGPDPQR